MQNKILSVLEKETNLSYNVKKGVLYGTYKNYYVSLQDFRNFILISLPIKLSDNYNINELNSMLTKLNQEYSNVKSATYNNNSIEIRYGYKTIWKSNSDNILSILNILVREVTLNSLSTCCPTCGESTPISPFLVNNRFVPCCDNCKLEIKNSIEDNQNAIKEQKNNIIAGIVGGFLGSLIGVALWIVIGLAGYIAAICGLVLAVCTIKGYQLFGGKLDKKGMFITIIITILMVFVSQYLTLSLEIYNEFKADYAISTFDAIRAVPDFLKDADVSRSFYVNLGIGYILTLVCVVSQFKNSYKDANFKVKTEEL